MSLRVINSKIEQAEISSGRVVGSTQLNSCFKSSTK
jgi:hypothetical protein